MEKILEWSAAAISLIAFWRLGKRTRDGFAWMGLATGVWTIWGLLIGSYAVIGINVIGTAINFRNWIRWRRHNPTEIHHR